jgi:hypothetical protein
MNPDFARARLEQLEDRKYRNTGRPSRPSERVAAKRDPVAALAEELSKAIVQELHSSGETPSQRLNAEKSLRAALLRVFGQD